jgi:hypothetical protein
MTERESDSDLLAELLDERRSPDNTATNDNPVLTRRDEQKLLDEANHVAPPTLAPLDVGVELRDSGRQRATAVASFGAEAIEVVRRYPIPALLLAAGLAYLLTRRRKA